MPATVEDIENISVSFQGEVEGESLYVVGATVPVSCSVVFEVKTFPSTCFVSEVKASYVE